MTKVFIDWPVYTATSNGIRCLYELSHELRRKGFTVIGVPRDMSKYQKYSSHLPPHLRDIPVVKFPFGSAENILIASETAPHSTVAAARANNIRVAWWQLAPYGLLERTELPRHGEISMPFSSYTEPGVHFYFYFQPALSCEWEDGINAPFEVRVLRQSLLIYSGKGRLKRLPELLLDACSRSQINLITRSTPPTRKELFSLMKSSHGLISFDELTNLNLEAASVGLPVFLANPLFSEASRQQFSIPDYLVNVTMDASVFLGRVQERLNGRYNTISPSNLLSHNLATLEMIERIIIADPKSRQFIVQDSDRLNYRYYAKTLKRQRVIFTHIGGHAGGSLLFKCYCHQVSRGNTSSALLAIIRAMDNLYCYLNFLLVPLTLLSIRIIKVLRLISKFLGRSFPA
jgi:hypothetical protein